MSEKSQIIVIGAGAAGMMAAGRAAALGADVLLLEKMDRTGCKINITGNGRCNITNSRDLESFIAQFGANGRFLYGAFSRFFRNELVSFLLRYGVKCKTEPHNGKLYPTTDNARDIVRVFNQYLVDEKVKVSLNETVTAILTENGKVTGVSTINDYIPASTVILAAGGSSHPQTGSTGDGYTIAQALGHTIIETRPGLVPLVVKHTERAKMIQGGQIQQARVTAFQCKADDIDLSRVPKENTGRGLPGKRPKPPVIESRTGNTIITHFGLSGPSVLEMSLAIVDALKNGPVSVAIDLMPDKDISVVKKELQQAFDTHGKRGLKNILKDILGPKMINAFIEMAEISPDKPGSLITASERDRLASLMTSLRYDIAGPHSMKTAMVTAGGVSLKEIDPKTMASKLVEGLYLCGEVMDLDAGTGGYNLQAAFSTGYVAGESAAERATQER